MTTLYMLQPEVDGGWGDKTVVTNFPEVRSGQAMMHEVAFLEYRFDDWLGDDLLATGPCYIVTDRLARALRAAGLTGARFDVVEVSTSGQWEDWEDHRQQRPERLRTLPPFERLIPTGEARYRMDGTGVSWSGDDFCLGVCEDWSPPPSVEQTLSWRSPYDLVVSGRCLELLRQFQLKHCRIEEVLIPS